MNVLEINDTGLLLSDGARVIAESPGFAALEGSRTLHVGVAARARSRLDPRRAFNRFWYQLDASLSAPAGSAHTHADLAFAHLQSLREWTGEQPLILAVPGTFTREQLAILLGLVEAAGLRAEGLVDTAVAASTQVQTHETTLHLDVELHRFTLTVIDGGAAVSRERIEELSKPGLTAVWDALARVAALAFVQQTRFDPMHNATTEQALFDALPHWLGLLGESGNAVLELVSGSRTHRASLSRDDLVKRLSDPFEDVAAGVDRHGRPRPATLLLSARAAAIPGLAEHLEHATGIAAVRLDALAPARGALAQIERIVVPGAGLAHVTRLAGIARRTDAVVPGTGPTHVLVGDRALPLPRIAGDAMLPLSHLRDGLSGALRLLDGRLWIDGTPDTPVVLNGKAGRLPLRVGLGDRVEIDGTLLRLIEVLGP